LTFDSFATFEKERVYDSATEVIEITKIKTVKSDEKKNNVFVIISLYRDWKHMMVILILRQIVLTLRKLG
jgi:hypothetical protein